MKKIFNKIGFLLTAMVLLASPALAQLPLQQGDAVVTHSPNNVVVRVIHSSNTSSAPLGQNWNTATMTPAGTKPPNNYYSNWNSATLGNVFGITLDTHTNPNIYVSSTQIYSGSNTNASKVWRLDGTTGANTLVYNFANTTRSLGNLKYLKAGSTENIYVSNFDNGHIERLNGNSAGTALWTIQTPFNPKFGLANDNPNFLPYGLAVRNMGAGGYRLYYAKINTISPFNTNEIWSVNLNAAGDFIASSEHQEIFPTAALTTYAGTTIADIAFTDDGKKMLVGQQTWQAFGVICAHRSNVAEFVTQTTDHNWSASPNIFHAGGGSGFSSSCSGATGDWNCTGGVSYSNNVLHSDQNALGCESSVWFTSDLITYTSGYAYGVQGMNANGGSANALANSIVIDEDDNTTYADKMQLGDIEIYRTPLNCNPCNCGSWTGGPTLNNQVIAGQSLEGPKEKLNTPLQDEGKGLSTTTTVKGLKIVTTATVLPYNGLNLLAQVYPVQFVQGNVFGIINATYQCTGTCAATYTWSITNDATSASVATGTSLPIDIGHYNSLFQCGNYTLIIKAKCGTSNCDNVTIPIAIICEPPTCCVAKIEVDLTAASTAAAVNIPNPNAYSTTDLAYSLSYNLPMSEVRVSVEDFKLVANSPNCLNCNNRPVTWGNILAASLNGNAMGITNAGSPPTGSLPADYREAVYNTGTPLAPNSATVKVQLSLPAITELSCCEVSAYVCLKFTFKDTECRECVRMVCGNIKLIPPKGNGNGGGKSDEKTDAKKFNVLH